ncbi:unnamed protein product [Chironomus riparius]|uniref:DNA/RNA non-specific endonuclease domain-containing protein n=1 Tax=Chironomus riparius TaxID=315576 RepID=A0A9N9RSB4_9DIPT|nr:unnamed protein product [Chironomus riparius]
MYRIKYFCILLFATFCNSQYSQGPIQYGQSVFPQNIQPFGSYLNHASSSPSLNYQATNPNSYGLNTRLSTSSLNNPFSLSSSQRIQPIQQMMPNRNIQNPQFSSSFNNKNQMPSNTLFNNRDYSYQTHGTIQDNTRRTSIISSAGTKSQAPNAVLYQIVPLLQTPANNMLITNMNINNKNGQHSGCSLNFGPLRKNEPIFLNNGFDVLTPNQDNSLLVPEGFIVRADCGHGNRFVRTTRQQFILTCRRGWFYYTLTEHFRETSALGCERIPNSPNRPIVVRRTTSNCGQNTAIYQTGLYVQNNQEQRFIALYISCFHNAHSSVLYVQSFFWGLEVRPAGGLFRYPIINGWFDGNEDDIRITSNNFQTNSIRNLYSTRDFDRGHLSPYADYEFDLLRKATNLYFNMVPMTSNFNSGRWSSLENMVRFNVRQMHSNARILTGGLNVYTNNFLNNNPFAVKIPDLAFKVVNVNQDTTVYFMFVDQPVPAIIQRILQILNTQMCNPNFINNQNFLNRHQVTVPIFRACFERFFEFTWPEGF